MGMHRIETRVDAVAFLAFDVAVSYFQWNSCLL
jgi:hypothetical protein